ncbi:MAG TPA: M48 family metallopeptidase, partial [Agitococcus sp.]|nr:M48 family metallopeptidase [Agitococcus sp.]
NLELAKKPIECLEYVLVHELAHLLEPSHNHRFKAYMSHFLPDWQTRKALLNAASLAHQQAEES